MESYGELLRIAREEKKLTLETVERETSISKDYLEALENENVAAFHGEAYLVGFLRNYAEYLELDSESLIVLYHNMMLQEAPVPEGLIEKPKPSFVVPLIVISSIVVVLSVVGIIVGRCIVSKNKKSQDESAISRKGVQQKTYELSDKPINARVYVGDQIEIPTKDGNVILTVISDTNSKLGVQTPIGIQYFELSETRELDIDGNATVDMVLDVWEISSNENSRGAEVYIVRKDENAGQEIADGISIPTQQANANQTPVFEDNRSYPFTLNASFRKPCVFRYEVDRKNSVENYYTNGDVVTMTANNKVRVWLSNGNTVKFQIIAASQTYELEIAKAGECVVEDIKWIRTDDGRYRLVVEPID